MLQVVIGASFWACMWIAELANKALGDWVTANATDSK